MAKQMVQEGTGQEVIQGVVGMQAGTAMRITGFLSIGSAVTMIIGAALWGVTGTDLWATLADGTMAAYLTAVVDVKPLLVANTVFWILGVLLFGVAGTRLVNLCDQRSTWAQAALVCYRTAVPLAIISFLTMLVITIQIAPDTSATAVSLAEALGWIGTKADDLATILLIGAAPLLLSLVGRKEWMPKWLVGWGFLAGVCGLISLAAMFIPALINVGFLIVPVGMVWMIATGVVLLRPSR